MIDERKLLREIKKLYVENSKLIDEDTDDLYCLGKNFAYIEVDTLINELVNERGDYNV